MKPKKIAFVGEQPEHRYINGCMFNLVTQNNRSDMRIYDEAETKAIMDAPLFEVVKPNINNENEFDIRYNTSLIEKAIKKLNENNLRTKLNPDGTIAIFPKE